MLLFAVVLAASLVLATVIGGDVRRLAEVRVQHLELLIAAFAAKVGVAVVGTFHSPLALTIGRPLNVIGAALLLGVAAFNLRLPGAPIFGIGLLSNLAVIVSFGGRMPVLLPQGFDPTSPALPLIRSGLDPLHVLLPHPQGLWFLGDIFAVPSFFGHSSLFSVGDLLMAAGIAYLIIRWSQRPHPVAAVVNPTPTPAK